MNIAHPILALPTSPEHARRMVEGLLDFHRHAFGDLHMEANDGGGGDDPPAGEPTLNEHGYPDSTPVKDMTAEHQAAYWKHQSRGWESKAKSRDDYDSIKTERDKLKRDGMTADEQAIEDAKRSAAEEARSEERRSWSGRIVRTEIKAALIAAGRKPEDADVIASGVDPNTFLADSGEVDTDMVSKYVASAAPGAGGGRQWPDMGQGNRGSGGGTRESGDDLYDRHYGKKK